jgi:hypothetical protein
VASVIAKDAVAQKDRISIDISDMRDEIDTCRTDAAWQELPMSAKIRVLVRERLGLLKREQEQESTAK